MGNTIAASCACRVLVRWCTRDRAASLHLRLIPPYSCGQLKPTNWLSQEPDFLVKIWQQIWNRTGKRSSKMVFSCYSHTFWLRQNFEQHFWSILHLQMASDGWILGLRLRQPHQGCRVVNTFKHSVVDHKNWSFIDTCKYMQDMFYLFYHAIFRNPIISASLSAKSSDLLSI